MTWQFGDGFDCYAAVGDASSGYWDSGAGTVAGNTLVAGRFAGSQALSLQFGAAFVSVAKSSAVNDAAHHIVCAFRQTSVLSGSILGMYFQLSDGATNQVCIVFRSDGVILLTSATPVGTVLATYTGAVTAANTWFAFEFEVVINNTTGAFRARKNGNTSNDFDSGATLNTRPGANAYANKLTVGQQATGITHQIDDLLWRSDAASVPWVGDIRCYTRMPASDQSVQFSRIGTVTQTPFTSSVNPSVANGTARYSPFTATYDGAIGTASVSLSLGYTGNMKCSIFSSAGSVPNTVLGSATTITNPTAGSNLFTFGTPVTVVKGTQYWIGFDSDTSSGTWNAGAAASGLTSTTAYASFPAANPVTASGNAAVVSLMITPSANYQLVSEPQQDATTSYVYDSTVNDADFYGIAAIASTPVATVAVTTRGYMQKSDAGTRTAAMQLKSGATTVASTTATLSSSWGWVWRTDLTDPNTSAAWTAASVNNAQVGPKTIA